VSLPLLAEAPAARPAPAACLPPPRRRVLVIEDNRDSAETLKAVLELKNQEVEVAYDGEAGLARARAFRPELVFCDVGLPGLDGYQVARRIRADPSLAPILVALTGYAAPADRERATEAGFDHHLGKPIELARLDELLAAPGRAG
jgi:CheY-like chemotaxis protein